MIVAKFIFNVFVVYQKDVEGIKQILLLFKKSLHGAMIGRISEIVFCILH